MKITKKQAKDFLEDIKAEDKVAIVCHTDLDGIASGILLYQFCKKKGAKVEKFPVELGEGTLLNITKQLEMFDKILMADIPPSYVETNLDSLEYKKIFYTDHHQKDTEISDWIMELRTTEEGYIPSSKTCLEITSGNPWFGIAGLVADYGWDHKENEKIINNFLVKVKMSLEEFKKIVNKISNFLIYFKKDIKRAFEILENKENFRDLSDIEEYSEKVSNEIEKIEEDYEKNKEKFGKINFYYLEPKFHIKSIVATRISSRRPKEIFVFANPFKEDPETISLSARHQSPGANVIEVLKRGIKNLEDASAGGHFRAAGGHIQAKDLGKFKENLKKFAKTIS